jgi:hypothetical protein
MSSNMTELLGAIDNPALIIEVLLKSTDERHVSFNFPFANYYQTEPATVQLYCECWRAENELYCRISDDATFMPANAVNLSHPLRLDPVTIKKPWGEEIWYTGIEARGVCGVEGIPLPWLIALSPHRILGVANRDPILLKILAPFRQPRYGDLYLELHEHKIEVYVVTQIDAKAWPDGKGQIRFGFNPAMVDKYPNEADFRKAYLTCVNAYREVRQRIDTQLDSIRSAQGYEPNAIVAPELLEHWRLQLDDDLNQEEAERLTAMNAFTALHELNLGSVIQVKPLTPHSLQHGVRVIEFQSPHYERFILSFAQKVLTQSHWDSDTAIARADMSAEMAPTTKPITRQKDCSIDQIVNFAEFEVRSLSLAPGAHHTLELDSYAVLIGVEGVVEIGTKTIKSEEAVLITALSVSQNLINCSEKYAVALLAIPTKL